MARRKAEELNALEQDVARSRRALAETWRALRRRGESGGPGLVHAGAKPRAARGSQAMLVLGGLVGLGLTLPRIVVRLSTGRPVGNASDRLP